jgi:hypothetical protein
MAYYNYNYLSDIKLGVAWLDITDRITDDLALSLSKNITEYWIQENENFRLKTICNKDPNEILSWAAEQDLNHVLVVAVGNNLSKRDNLYHSLPKFFENNTDFAVAGHILDKGEKYYELHHQCFIVNVQWWKNAGRPLIGKEEQSTEWQTTKPKRSQENWHDNYTPHWIAKGDETQSYTGKRFGWNIINQALESNAKVISFDETIRDSKYYIYPEVTKDFHTKIADVLDSVQGFFHFAANTESPPTKLPDSDVCGVICTAGGITPLLSAYTAGLKPGGKVTVFDFSPISLSIQRQLKENNCDYKNFKQDLYALFNSLDISSILKADRNLDKMQSIINELLPAGLEQFINEVWPTLDIVYNNCNLFGVHQVQRKLLDRHRGEKTFIHLTNILHYQNTAWLYSAVNRYRIEDDLLKMFADNGNNSFILYQNRPGIGVNWRSNTPEEILGKPDKFLYKCKDLEILPWIKK